MDRANPSPADVPSAVPGTSSAVPSTNPADTTPAPALAPGTQTAQPAPVPAPSGTGGQQPTDLQSQRETLTSQGPPQQSTTGHPHSQQATNTDNAPQERPQPASPQSPHQPIPTTTREGLAPPGARPTTDSTLGGLTTDTHHPSNPPTPPAARPPLPHIRTARSGMTTSMEKLEDSDTLSGLGLNELHRDSAIRTNQTLPPLPPVRLVDNGLPRRQRTLDGPGSALGHGRRPGIDWIVPVEEKRRRTVGERIQPTLEIAIAERDKSASKAKTMGLTINAAIALQVILGSLTTGLSAVATAGSKQTSVATTVLGALTTMIASYLAKVRGSSEPEFSKIRAKNLNRFIREAQAFLLDHGHVDTNEWDKVIDSLRQELEDIVNTKKEKKLSSSA